MNASFIPPVALLMAAGLLAACASQPASEPRAGTEQVDTTSPELSDEERLALLEDQAPVTEQVRRDHRSVRPLGHGHNVTVYSEQELRDTGRTDLGEALRALDPRFQ